ncbi:MAG: hypothetical protein AAFU03_16520, partial [Bacteroidota bacterium]
ATFASFLLATCDLNCTYAHYGIPASGYILAVFLAILGGIQLERGKWWGLINLAVGAAMSFAFKFDFIPFIIGGIFLLFLVLRKGTPTGARLHVKQPWWVIPVGIGLVAFAFGLLTGFSWPIDGIKASWRILRDVNENHIGQDNHWVDNPVVYFAATLAGIGFPVFFLALIGLRKLKRSHFSLHPGLWLFLGIIFCELLVRWSIDTPFVRRVMVFMPAICLGAAYAWEKLILPKEVTLGIMFYTLFFTLVGQSNHWFDSRAAAREWINSQFTAGEKVVTGPYVYIKGLKEFPSFKPDGDWEYAVIHETYYQRYGLSLTTPFGYPTCCEEVYHCQSQRECEKMQAMIKGTDPETELIAHFSTRNWFPERWLYHQFFGTYETFVGDVLVFRRKG